jgi:putative redox protein
MVYIKVIYDGDLHCTLTHGPSGTTIKTDAPTDNMGKGEFFSPTDLVAAALGSCIVTIMGIYAKKNHISLIGLKAEVSKEMMSVPVRKISRLEAKISMPKGLTPSQRQALEKVALTCPVHKSLSSEVAAPISFHYED